MRRRGEEGVIGRKRGGSRGKTPQSEVAASPKLESSSTFSATRQNKTSFPYVKRIRLEGILLQGSHIWDAQSIPMERTHASVRLGYTPDKSEKKLHDEQEESDQQALDFGAIAHHP